VLGEFSICVWDERRALSSTDTDERWRSEVSYSQHGQSRLWGGTSCFLCGWNHVRIETLACREHCVQVIFVLKTFVFLDVVLYLIVIAWLLKLRLSSATGDVSNSLIFMARTVTIMQSILRQKYCCELWIIWLIGRYLLLCCRDLKPENILLDDNGTFIWHAVLEYTFSW